jgi:hypothetical protein
VIFHDPLLSFFYGSSSHTFFANAPHRVLPARGHPVGSFVTYGLTLAGTVGWLLLPLALLGLVLFAWRMRLRSPTLPVYLTLVPFAFYWLVLYKGANTEALPELGQGPPYNIRFGLAMIPAVGVFAAYLAVARPRVLGRLLLASALALALAWGVLNSVQTPYVLREALYGPSGSPTEAAGKQDAAWLASRYHGGPVLITYVNSQTTMFYLLTKHKFADRAFITDANGAQFTAALARPWESVRWIVVNSDAANGVSPIWVSLHGRTDWQRYFVLRATLATTQIYERRASPSPSPSVTADAYAAIFAARERGSLESRPSVVAARHVRRESARRASRRRNGRRGRSRVNQRVPTLTVAQATASAQASPAAPLPTPVPTTPQPALRSSSAGGQAGHAAPLRSAPRPSPRSGGSRKTSFGRGSFENSG